MEVNLGHYRIFHQVCKTSSISVAAKNLFLSQPAVSRTIRMLEQGLGCQLFVRLPRGVQMTAEGETLYRYISQAMVNIEAGQDKVRRLAEYESGVLELGTTENALHYFLLPKLQAFRKQYPKVHIHVAGSSTRELLDMVRAGTVDLALIMEPLRNVTGMRISRLRSFQDAFIAGEAFSHLNNRIVSTRELCQYPLIGLEQGTSSRQYISDWFEAQGSSFEPEYSVRTSTLVMPFVESGIGIGLMPIDALMDRRFGAGLFEISLETPIEPRWLCLAVSDNAPTSALRRQFISYIQE